MSKHRSMQEWKELLTQAYYEGPNDQHWCKHHGIVYRSFRAARKRLKEAGQLDHLYQLLTLSIPKESTNKGYVILPLETGDHLYLMLDPVKRNLTAESLTQLLRFAYGLSCQKGQIFLFITKSRKQLLVFGQNESGVFRFEHSRHQGNFGWPCRAEHTWVATIPQGEQTRILRTLKSEKSLL